MSFLTIHVQLLNSYDFIIMTIIVRDPSGHNIFSKNWFVCGKRFASPEIGNLVPLSLPEDNRMFFDWSPDSNFSPFLFQLMA